MEDQAPSMGWKEASTVLWILLGLLVVLFGLGYLAEYTYMLGEPATAASLRWWPVLNLMIHCWIFWQLWEHLVKVRPLWRFVSHGPFIVRRLSICIGLPVVTFLLCVGLGISRSLYLDVSHCEMWIAFVSMITRKDLKQVTAMKEANIQGGILVPGPRD